MERQNDEIEIDLMEILYVIRDKIVIIVLTAMVFGIASGLFTHYMVTPKYASTSSIYVVTAGSATISVADLQIGNALTNDYVQLIQSRTVLNQVINNLKMENELTYQGLRKCVSIVNPSDTRILNITVTYEDPRIAKELVDELAKVSVETIATIMVTNSANIFEHGYINNNPVSPNTKRNIAIAAIAGIILAVGISIVLHVMDDTIHSSEDIERYLKLNTLAAIPVSEDSEAQIRKDDRKRRRGSKRKHEKSKKS